MSEGWVKLHRKIIESNMYQNLNAVQRDVMIQCLILANHKPKKWEWNSCIFTCEPGQFITSLESLRLKCAKNTSIKRIRTALLKLEKWEFLASQGASNGRLITVINWSTYQEIDYEKGKQEGKQGANEGQTKGKRRATNNNVKNVKNEKNVKKDIYGEFQNVFLAADEYEKVKVKFGDLLPEKSKP